MHNKNPPEFAVLAGTSEWKLTDTQVVLYHTSRAQSAVHGLGLNCKENSGLVNFVLESRLSFTNQFHLQKRLRRPETGIKDGFEEMENKFPRLLFQKFFYFFRCSRKYSAGTARNCRVPFTSQPDFPKTS